MLGEEDVQLLSVAIDSVGALLTDANRLGINTPFLSDADRAVSRSDGLPLRDYFGEPGHIFVLVGKDGVIKWVKNYAVPGHDPVMYVSPDELNKEISKYLDTP